MDTPPAEIEAPSAGDYLGNWMAQNPGADTAGDLPVPQPDAVNPPAETPPAADTPENPPAPEKPFRPEATARVQMKQKSVEEIAALKAQLADWEKKHTDETTKLNTEVVENRTLAEERKARLEELEKSYRNDAEKEWHSSVDELPEVQTSAQKAEASFMAFFPKRLSNPVEDEADIRFSVRDLPPDKFPQIERQILQWAQAEYNTEAAAGWRTDAQQIALSNVAHILGVRPEAFEEKIVGGRPFQVLRPSHPVYRHLSDNVETLVENRNNHVNIRQQAAGNVRESFLSATRHRQENSRKMFTNAGLGVSGDELDSRLRQSPENLLLKSMQLLQSDPDLIKELKENMEHEAVLNGHMTPKLLLAETDPAERTRAANAHNQRIGQRAIHAPLAVPLQKLALKQHAEIQELKAALKAYKESEEKAASQNEPGLAGGTPPAKTETPLFGGPGSNYFESAFQRNGLTASR